VKPVQHEVYKERHLPKYSRTFRSDELRQRKPYPHFESLFSCYNWSHL